MTTLPTRADLARARVLVIGDVMLDRYWFSSVDRISPEAPVPVALVRRTDERLGGAANVARNVASLGGRSHLVGLIGADEPGATLHRMIRELGVGDGLIDDAAMATIVKLRVLAHQQQLLRIDFEEKPDASLADAVLAAARAAIAEADVVVLSDYGKGCLARSRELIAAAREAGKPVIVDPKGRDYARYAGATLITPNRSELMEVVGRWTSEEDLHERAEKLRAELGIDNLLLTRSEEGMTLFDAAGAHHSPAQAKEVYDVSGAGDTVIATVSTLVACGLPVADTLSIANKAGGIVVGKLGTSIVTADELFGADAG